jgi:hypothetical protein
MADGLKTALALLENQVVEQEHQPSLLSDDQPEADLPLVDSTLRRSGPKGGRPKGALNRSTQEWVRYIGSRYRSPLVGLAETWSRSVADLARELGLYRYGSDGKPLLDKDGNPELNLVEAFKLQQSAMVNALPYLHSKMPQAIHVQQKERGLLIIGDLGEPLEEAGDVLTLNLAEYEEKQEVSETQNQKSDNGKVG